jgi:outer membrane lipoprotein-sorting protein
MIKRFGEDRKFMGQRFKQVKLLIITVTVVSMFSSITPKTTGNQVVVAPILDRMAQALQGMGTMKATLAQRKTYGQLGISDPVEQGYIYIKRQRNRDLSVRIEIQQPSKRVITVKNGRFTFFQPSINQAIEGEVSQKVGQSSATGFLSYLFGGLGNATKDYKISVLGEEVVNGRRATHLELVPWTMRKGLYRQIDIWVDNQLWLPTQQEFVEANDDVTRLRLQEVQLNIRLSDKLFEQDLPGHVQRIRG